MGQDIHLIMEYRSSANSDWQSVTNEEEVWVWRDYSVFNTLVATARGDVPESIVAEERGLPVDASSSAIHALTVARDDLHTHSWISWGEFQRFFPWTTPYEMSHFALIGWQFGARAWYNAQRRFVFAFDC